MSKQLIERLRGFKDTPRTADNLCHEAADRIEELERENNELAARIGKELNEENLALQAEIAELVAALERIGKYPRVSGDELGYEGCRAVAREALAKVRKP